jgi:hypothetical protein
MVNLMSFKCSEDKPINKQPEERTGWLLRLGGKDAYDWLPVVWG